MKLQELIHHVGQLLFFFIILATLTTTADNQPKNQRGHHTHTKTTNTFISPVSTATVTTADHRQQQQQQQQQYNAYICLTGQLSRLELKNKISQIITPLHNMGFGLYIGLVISTGPTRYVNNDNGDKMRLFTSLSQVRQTLWNVSGVKGVKHFPELDTFHS